MSDVVFILGAGASRQGGAPLMNDFIDSAEQLLRADNCGNEKRSFELVFKAIAALQPVYAKAVIDTNNLEAVFAAFEMAQLFGQLDGLSSPELDELPHAIRRVIVRTLEQRIEFPVVTGGMRAPRPYGQFCALLKTLSATRPVRPLSVSVLTFNYDLSIDFGLHSNGVQVDYGLDPEDHDGSFDLLKLHGSLNWVTCDTCKRVVPWRLDKFFKIFGFNDIFDGKDVRLDVGQKLTAFAHCPNTPPPHTADPVIVPPTWSKTAHYDAIAPVWKRAANHLAEALDIIVIGYSLPDTDEFFRYLYALGTVSDRRLRRFWVIDPDPAGRVTARFKALLGPVALNRFRHFQNTFEDAFHELNQAYITEISTGIVV